MKNLAFKMRIVLFMILFVLLTVSSGQVFGNGIDHYSDDHYPDSEVKEKSLSTKDEKQVGPDPQRLYCERQWNKYYSERGIDIKVSTRGQYDEIVVFRCPDCSLEKHFVDPFLQGERDGMTGMERIRACGFTKAVFIGTKGIREIEKDVMISQK